jgi:hypothetical protein
MNGITRFDTWLSKLENHQKRRYLKTPILPNPTQPVRNFEAAPRFVLEMF